MLEQSVVPIRVENQEESSQAPFTQESPDADPGCRQLVAEEQTAFTHRHSTRRITKPNYTKMHICYASMTTGYISL